MRSHIALVLTCFLFCKNNNKRKSVRDVNMRNVSNAFFSFDSNNFPFDTHQCKQRYASWAHPNSSLHLQPGSISNLEQLFRNEGLIAFRLNATYHFDCRVANHTFRCWKRSFRVWAILQRRRRQCFCNRAQLFCCVSILLNMLACEAVLKQI